MKKLKNVESAQLWLLLIINPLQPDWKHTSLFVIKQFQLGFSIFKAQEWFVHKILFL